jgi:hypothetical protein
VPSSVHVRRLGIDIDDLANPLQASVASALAFSMGAAIPLLTGMCWKAPCDALPVHACAAASHHVEGPCLHVLSFCLAAPRGQAQAVIIIHGPTLAPLHPTSPHLPPNPRRVYH